MQGRACSCTIIFPNSLEQLHHLLAKKKGEPSPLGICLHLRFCCQLTPPAQIPKKIVKKRQTSLPKQALCMLILAGREQTTGPMGESPCHRAARRPGMPQGLSVAPEEGLFTELSLSPPSWMAFGKAVVSLRTLWQVAR